MILNSMMFFVRKRDCVYCSKAENECRIYVCRNVEYNQTKAKKKILTEQSLRIKILKKVGADLLGWAGKW